MTEANQAIYLKCYSQILCGGSAEIFRFCHLGWPSHKKKTKKTRNPEAELQGLVNFGRT